MEKMEPAWLIIEVLEIPLETRFFEDYKYYQQRILTLYLRRVTQKGCTARPKEA